MTHEDQEIQPYENTWTFALDEQGDIQYDERNTVPIATGPAAVSQSLRVALATVQGEDPIDHDFGLDVFEATRSTAFLKREVQRALMYDDKDHNRVETITDVTVYRRPNRTAEVHVTAMLEQENFTLVFNLGGFFR